MLKKIKRTEEFSKKSTVSAAILAFLAGIASLLTLIDTVSVVMTWLAMGLAFISAIGSVANLFFDRHKDNLEEAFKKTPPKIKVDIKTKESDQKLYVVIEPENEVPFEYNYKVVTRNNIVVSGIMLDWGKIYPDKIKPFGLDYIGIDLSKVLDSYIELRFDYRSIYAAELHESSLTGKIIKSYRLSDDKKYVIPSE